MKKLLWVVLALWPLLAAQTYGGKPYSAETVMKAKGQPEMVSRIYMGGQDRWRVEMAGQPQVQVVRLDRKLMYMIMPAAKTYYEMPLSGEEAESPGSHYPAGKLSRRFLGKDTVNGQPTRKFEVTVTASGQKPQVFTEWWSDAFGMPLRIVPADGSWTMEQRNVKLGPQDAKLFEVPAGYTKMSLPGLPPAMKRR